MSNTIANIRLLEDGKNYIGKCKLLFKYDCATREINGKTVIFRSMQGACFYNGNIMTALAHVDPETYVETVVLREMDLNGNTIRESEVLPLDHANNITYNEKLGLLVVSHCQAKGDRSKYYTYSLVDPKDFSIIKTEALENPFFSMAYSAERDMYASAEWEGRAIDIWDNNFKVALSVPVKADNESTSQGVFCDESYIYFVRSGKNGNASRFLVYNWQAELVRKVMLDLDAVAIEPETVNIYNGKTYVTCNYLEPRRGEVYTVDFEEI